MRTAWSEAFRALLDKEAVNLYALVPPAAALLAAAPDGPNSVLAQQVHSVLWRRCLPPLCKTLSPQLINLSGCLVQQYAW